LGLGVRLALPVFGALGELLGAVVSADKQGNRSTKLIVFVAQAVIAAVKGLNRLSANVTYDPTLALFE
jgi:hypothetical protein